MRLLKAISFKKRYQFNINATFGNVFNHPVYYGGYKLLYSATPVDLLTGQILTKYDKNVTTPQPTQSINFGQMNVSQSGGISRVIRFGAEFNF